MAKKVTMYRRMVIYKEAIEILIRDYYVYRRGMCYAIETARDIKEPDPYNHMECYPEILRHKPEVLLPDNYWFPRDAEGLAKRLEILGLAVTEIQNKLKKNKKKYKI